VAKKNTDIDMDLTEALPEDLGGTEQEESSNYVPATRQGMGMMAPGDAVVLDMDGVRPPFLTLVHGTSQKLVERFNAGDLVLKGDHLVCAKGSKMQCIILAIDQYQKERLSSDAWGEGKRPRTFKTKEEAAAAGLCVTWDDKTGRKPEVSPAMDLILLIRRGEGINDALFGVDLGIEDNGKPTEFGFCLLSVDKTGAKLDQLDAFPQGQVVSRGTWAMIGQQKHGMRRLPRDQPLMQIAGGDGVGPGQLLDLGSVERGALFDLR
jgi:hypothetical protein